MHPTTSKIPNEHEGEICEGEDMAILPIRMLSTIDAFVCGNEFEAEEVNGDDDWRNDGKYQSADWRALELDTNYYLCVECLNYWGRRETPYVRGVCLENAIKYAKIVDPQDEMQVACRKCHGVEYTCTIWEKETNVLEELNFFQGEMVDQSGVWMLLPTKTVTEGNMTIICLCPLESEDVTPPVWECIPRKLYTHESGNVSLSSQNVLGTKHY